ncbi:MAG: CobW family GTP-binding protein [Limisphaerales bacterium]
MSAPRVPLVLLTGFLGAGKTTLVRRWLTDFPATGRRLGLVMNEFGAVPVDTLLVTRPDLPVQEVEGGCLCCAPDADLARAVNTLARGRGCDLIVIEPSGLADPVATLDALTDPDVLGRFELRGVLALLDAAAYARPDADPAEWPLLKQHIRYADWLLLTKCDTAPADAAQRLEESARALNPHAPVRRLPYNPPSLDDVLAAAPPLRELPAEADAAAPHDHARYRSVSFKLPLPVNRSAFEGFLAGLDRREVVRGKGFVRFSGQPDQVFLFQSVYGNYLIEQFTARPEPEPVAVFIGPALDAVKCAAQLRTLVWGAARR